MGERDDRFWAEFLGIDPSLWHSPGVSIQSHVGLKGYRGFWCFRHKERTVVSAPEGWVTLLESIFGGTTNDLLDAAFIRNALGSNVEATIGPAFQGTLNLDKFRTAASGAVQTLTQVDDATVHQLRLRCTPEDWQTSGIEKAPSFRTAAIVGDSIAALAGYRAWTRDAGDPCVVTSAEHRGRGYGTAAVHGVVAQALKDDKLPLYQTLESNTGAVRIATKLGYEQYAKHLAVRLKAP